ncbi:cysteine desulfurase [Roseateles sp. DAIF2]|uniref:family 2A encapsulin nanocompartment cargo protein cysteine desulfurase n=1 Tax=Roseateles sp. DAIF2 TaxID=2714952 RepID=UPI0018A2F702|nr:family 2A encapsulin nanocompartment cargo protein cysteine desulfurase [Roseateles sp. DAIF2]QPF73889.1 cysteine desulfurase [Roseateles sp. DAIF2]
MTIQTPTSEALSAGPLDLAALNRLAGEFFAEAAGKPPSSSSELSLAEAPAPRLEAAPPQQVHAAQAPRQGGQAQGVPQAYAAALPLPATAPSRPSVGGGGYYFVDEAAPALASGTAPPPVADWLSPQAFGLPGQDALLALLAEPKPPSQPQPGADYYFVQPAQVEAHEERAGSPQLQPRSVPGGFDVAAVRRDFPILAERVNGKPLVWLDNAATTHKPRQVIERLAYFYAHENSNIHRAAHELAARATDAYEGARQIVARFLGAASTEEIIFVRGATEGINLVAKSWGAKHIGAGDEIIVSQLEHHANIVPWQQLAADKGAKLRVILVDDSGQLRLDEYRKLLNPRTKLVAVTQVSNALGTITPVQEIVALAKAAGVTTLVDGAQSVSHLPVHLQTLGADFFVFSGHKVFAPTGIGVVYGRREVLEQTPPWQGGGNMIADVSFERTIYQPPPARFEAGTGNIADAVGLGAALEYLQGLGLPRVAQYEHDLLDYATERLRPIPGLRLIGTAAAKTSVLSFVLNGYSTEQVGRALNEEGIAVRSGHHCAQPILRRFGLEATVRPSLAFYNTCEEIDLLTDVVRRLATRR